MILKNILKYNKINVQSFRSVSTLNIAEVNSSDADLNALPTKSYDEIPGPSSLPIIGQLHHFLPGGTLHKYKGVYLQKYLYDTYGPIVKLKGHFGGPDNILLFDAESTAQVLRSENLLPKRPAFYSLEYYRKMMNERKQVKDKFTGLTTDHGNEWKELRNTVNPVMMKPSSIKDYAAPLEEVVQEVVLRLKSLRNKNNMIESNFNEEVMLWILESFGVLTLGARLNCFDPNLPKDSAGRRMIRSVRDFFTITDKLDFEPSIWRYFPSRTFNRAMKIYEEIENLNVELIDNYIKNKKKECDTNREKGIFEKVYNIDEKLVSHVASDLLFTGIDTVGNMMIFILYSLARNPEKQNILREELQTMNERKPYLKACIKETMRLMPVIFGNTRETSKEYNLLGYKIPKQTYILLGHQVMSLMECYFPRPHEYIPERWLVDKDDPLYYGNAHPFALNSFGYGARACIGRRVAELELETFITRIIENFQLEWVGEPMKIKQSVVNYALGPFNFVFKDLK